MKPSAGGQAGEIHIGESARLAEDDIGFAGVRAAIVATGSPDDDVVEAVAIDIARRGDAATRQVACCIALDDEPVCRGEGGEIDIGEPGRLAEDDIGFAGVGAAIVATGRANDDVVEAVTVDIACGRDAASEGIECGIALDDEAQARGERGQVDIGVEELASSPAEDDIGLAGVAAAIVAERRADDDVVKAVAIDIAG